MPIPVPDTDMALLARKNLLPTFFKSDLGIPIPLSIMLINIELARTFVNILIVYKTDKVF